MIRTVRSVSVIALLSALVCAGLLAGCGNNQSNVPMPPPSASSSTPKVAATGPAISTTLSFDQLALESPVKKVKGKNGLVFLHFTYADNDGSIYKCELPEAMSKGDYSPQEWVRTFGVYKAPKVIGRKNVVNKGPTVIGDFPFISPRPQQAEKPAGGASPSPEPLRMPTLPAMPNQGEPMTSPRGGPSVAPRPPMD